jgi:hypothetical protein
MQAISRLATRGRAETAVVRLLPGAARVWMPVARFR